MRIRVPSGRKTYIKTHLVKHYKLKHSSLTNEDTSDFNKVVEHKHSYPKLSPRHFSFNVGLHGTFFGNTYRETLDLLYQGKGVRVDQPHE